MAETPVEKSDADLKGELDGANVPQTVRLGGNLGHTKETSAERAADADCWQAWFDGAAHPNPGRIGLGGMLLSPSGERHELSMLARSGCNNEAELLALLAVLELARAKGARRIRLYGDSDFVIRAGLACQSQQAARRFAITQIERLLPLIARLDEALSHFDALDLVWIPRHRNGVADRLSRQALGLPHKPAPVPGKKLSGKRSRRRR